MIRGLIILLLIALPIHAAKTSLWLYDKDPRGLDSLRRYGHLVAEANPLWYNISPENHVVAREGANDPAWRAAMRGMEVIPIIQNAWMGEFGIKQTHEMIVDMDGRERHANEILQLVLDNDYDGIEIDYEWMMPETRDPFTAFVALVADKLHAHGKILSVTLHQKRRDRDDMGPGSQDWAALARHADRLKIMAYNFSWATSEPGPIAPPEWLAEIARYAQGRIPPEKLYFGLPWYGYNWKEGEGRTVLWEDAQNILRVEKPNDHMRDPESGELRFSYRAHTVYYQDVEAMQRKVEAVMRVFPKIGGFAYWRAGGEDPAMWRVVQDTREPVRRRTVRSSALTMAPQVVMLIAFTIAAGVYLIVSRNASIAE